MPLTDLVFIKKLGEGQFGHVFLVKGKETKEYYALKAVSKFQIIQETLEKHTLVSLKSNSIAREGSVGTGELPLHNEDV